MNEVKGKYFDIFIENDTFIILDTSSPPPNEESILSTLKKTEEILKRGLKYSTAYDDRYSKLSEKRLLKILKNKVSGITNEYIKNSSQSDWFLLSLNKTQQDIKEICTRIDYLLFPPMVLPLPDDLIPLITNYLELTDLANFSLLNRHGKAHANTAFIRRACQFGFKGNRLYAKKYLSHLFHEIKLSYKEGYLPKQLCNNKYTKNIVNYNENEQNQASFSTNILNVIYKKIYSGVNYEKTLQNLKSLTTPDIFILFSQLHFHTRYSLALKKYFMLFQNHWVITKVDCEETKRKGSKALRLGVKYRELDLVYLLLKHGADPNIPASNGSPPLHWAAQNGWTDCVKLLLMHGAQVNRRGCGGITPLGFACSSDQVKTNVSVIKLLLQNGADPNIPSKKRIPLHEAVQKRWTDSVELLLMHGANVNEMNKKGNTALHLACSRWKENADVVKLLLEYGANPNIPASNGSSPLHWAAVRGRAKSVELLLAYGANVNDLGTEGETALHLACGSRKTLSDQPSAQVVELLLKNGADPNIPSKKNITPFKVAQERDLKNIVALLLQYNAHI